MKKQELLLVLAVAYVVVGLVLWFIHDQANVRFSVAFPSKFQYGLTWPYWEVKALTQ